MDDPILNLEDGEAKPMSNDDLGELMMSQRESCGGDNDRTCKSLG